MKIAMKIAVVNSKGGVGKTTTAVTLGILLGKKKRVLVVDMDPQAHATSCLLNFLPDKRNTIYPVLLELRDIKDVVTESQYGIDVVPSCPDLAAVDLFLLNQPERNKKLRKALSQIEGNYDFIFIDCPPSLGPLSLNALVAADRAIIPISPGELPFLAMIETLKVMVEVYRKENRGLKPLGFLPTMIEGKTRIARETLEKLSGDLTLVVDGKEITIKIPILPAIPKSVRVAEEPSRRPIIFHPSHPVTRAYEKVAEILEEIHGNSRVGCAS